MKTKKYNDKPKHCSLYRGFFIFIVSILSLEGLLTFMVYWPHLNFLNYLTHNQ